MNIFTLKSERAQAIRSVAVIAVIILATMALTLFLPVDPAQFGIFSLIPAIFLIAYIFATKRVVEGLVLATIVGVIMVTRPETVALVHPDQDVYGWAKNSFLTFSSMLTDTMLDPDIVWLIIVCGLMGSIISLIERSGGAFAFGNWAAKHAKTQKSSLIWTWILGIAIFVDDYLNSLTLGACMTPLTDKHKVPREYLAYVVDSTAAPVCVLIPITTWSAFVAGLLEKYGAAAEGEGLLYFIRTIPFNFYGWIAVLIVPLTILGIVPRLGAMKKAFERVEKGGPLAPEGSEKIDIHAGGQVEVPENPRIINMILPIAVLIAGTVLLDLEMQHGVLLTLGFMYVFYLLQGIMDAETFVDVCLEGFKNMLLPLLLMVLAFLFARVNAEIHFTEFVISSAVQLVTPAFLPLVVFIALGITEFITGTNWGMYIIALPIVIPLAQQLGANEVLTVAAVLSAGVFGSHICFYSDATVVTSAATGCDNLRHAVTQLPYGLLAAVLSALAYLLMGFIL